MLRQLYPKKHKILGILFICTFQTMGRKITLCYARTHVHAHTRVALGWWAKWLLDVPLSPLLVTLASIPGSTGRQQKQHHLAGAGPLSCLMMPWSYMLHWETLWKIKMAAAQCSLKKCSKGPMAGIRSGTCQGTGALTDTQGFQVLTTSPYTHTWSEDTWSQPHYKKG